jgi:hypothetical protein
MDTIEFKVENELDIVRLDSGNDGLRNYFKQLVQKNRERAIELINRDDLKFTSLFVLRGEIQQLGLFSQVNIRNKIALEIIDEALKENRVELTPSDMVSNFVQNVRASLKWVITTGAFDDGMSDELDEVMDVTAILLVKVYKDKSILPLLSDMIFKRYKLGTNIHDLAWAFFEGKDPYSLVLIGSRLRSNEMKDVELACRLLCFVPGVDAKSNVDGETQYVHLYNWIEENRPFLYFTGESFQQKNSPAPYVVVLEAKYLCKVISTDTGKALEPLMREENKLLEDFDRLDEAERILLSSYSCKIHRDDVNGWNTWIHSPIEEQIRIAEGKEGEAHD